MIDLFSDKDESNLTPGDYSNVESDTCSDDNSGGSGRDTTSDGSSSDSDSDSSSSSSSGSSSESDSEVSAVVQKTKKSTNGKLLDKSRSTVISFGSGSDLRVFDSVLAQARSLNSE